MDLPNVVLPSKKRHRFPIYNNKQRLYQFGIKTELTGVTMTKSRGVAILVGAGDAIGAAVARRFARGGYSVCICRRDAAKSQGLIDELKAEGHGIHAFSVDARQEKEVQDLFAKVEQEVG